MAAWPMLETSATDAGADSGHKSSGRIGEGRLAIVVAKAPSSGPSDHLLPKGRRERARKRYCAPPSPTTMNGAQCEGGLPSAIRLSMAVRNASARPILGDAASVANVLVVSTTAASE